jgi:hypothetical protein
MARKSKFKPVITRVKLNPEQAVLSCSCYTAGFVQHPSNMNWANTNERFSACNVKAIVSNIRGCLVGVNAGFGQWRNMSTSATSS